MLSSVTAMPRLSLTLRALLLVPLLAVGVDLARATLACGPRAESCLEAAGRGWLGPAGVVLILLYAAALSVGIARLARGMAARPRRAALGRPPCGRSAAPAWPPCAAARRFIAGALDDPAALGGGWLALVALLPPRRRRRGARSGRRPRRPPRSAPSGPPRPRPPAAAPLLLLVPAAPTAPTAGSPRAGRRRPCAPPPLTTG